MVLVTSFYNLLSVSGLSFLCKTTKKTWYLTRLKIVVNRKWPRSEDEVTDLPSHGQMESDDVTVWFERRRTEEKEGKEGGDKTPPLLETSSLLSLSFILRPLHPKGTPCLLLLFSLFFYSSVQLQPYSMILLFLQQLQLKHRFVSSLPFLRLSRIDSHTLSHKDGWSQICSVSSSLSILRRILKSSHEWFRESESV